MTRDSTATETALIFGRRLSTGVSRGDILSGADEAVSALEDSP